MSKQRIEREFVVLEDGGKRAALQKEHTDCQGRLNGPQMCSRQVKSRHQRQRLEREEPHKIKPFK